jgi:hypothetical protein
MLVRFDPDWDYLLDKACEQYERIPYVNSKTCYSYVDYYDKHIEEFIGNTKREPIIIHKNKTKYNAPHTLGLEKIVATRLEWRWEYKGVRYFPKRAKSVVEWDLFKQEGKLIDLLKGNNMLRVIQPESIYFCVYGEANYDKAVENYNKVWGSPRQK